MLTLILNQFHFKLELETLLADTELERRPRRFDLPRAEDAAEPIKELSSLSKVGAGVLANEFEEPEGLELRERELGLLISKRLSSE